MYQPAPVSVAQRSNSDAIKSVVLGLIPFFLCMVPLVNIFVGIPAGLFSVVFGMRGMKRWPSGHGVAATGLVMSGLGLVVCAFWAWFTVFGLLGMVWS